MGGELAKADDEARHILLSFFYKADANYGEGLTKVAKADLKRVKALAAELRTKVPGPAPGMQWRLLCAAWVPVVSTRVGRWPGLLWRQYARSFADGSAAVGQQGRPGR